MIWQWSLWTTPTQSNVFQLQMRRSRILTPNQILMTSICKGEGHNFGYAGGDMILDNSTQSLMSYICKIRRSKIPDIVKEIQVTWDWNLWTTSTQILMSSGSELGVQDSGDTEDIQVIWYWNLLTAPTQFLLSSILRLGGQGFPLQLKDTRVLWYQNRGQTPTRFSNEFHMQIRGSRFRI